jgi:hypothetical protein
MRLRHHRCHSARPYTQLYFAKSRRNHHTRHLAGPSAREEPVPGELTRRQSFGGPSAREEPDPGELTRRRLFARPSAREEAVSASSDVGGRTAGDWLRSQALRACERCLSPTCCVRRLLAQNCRVAKLAPPATWLDKTSGTGTSRALRPERSQSPASSHDGGRTAWDGHQRTVPAPGVSLVRGSALPGFLAYHVVLPQRSVLC